MGSKINAGVNWSLAELKKLVDDKNSCVHFERAKRHIALHPIHLNNLNKALHEILSSSINFYDPELKGLLLSYKNPKLLSSLGSILYDSHFIHVDIEADFYVFRPAIGSTLSGIVNKQARSHVGVLVHKIFNVSIPRDEDYEMWQGQYANVGSELKFSVTHVDFKGRLPFIKGQLSSNSTRIHDDDSQLELSSRTLNNNTVNGKHSAHDDDDDNSDDDSDKITQKVVSKSSTCPNFLTSVLGQTSESSSEDESKTNNKPLVSKSKSKKDKVVTKYPKEHKKKSKSVIQSEDYVKSPSKKEALSNDNCSDSDIHLKKEKKKSKRRKKIEATDCVDTNTKFIVNEQEILDNELTEEVSPEAVPTIDRKPRIIHDRVLNGKEENVTINKDSIIPTKTKIKKYEENLLWNVKIKREPDMSDVESSSSNKFKRKQKKESMNETDDSFAQVTVKPEPIMIKAESKNKISSTKRKYKEEHKNNLKVKCESDTSDTDNIAVPKKKLKPKFSE